MITKDDVLYIADIAMLKFPEEEIDMFTEKFAQVIGFVDTIKEVNTEDVEPTFMVSDETGELKDYEGNVTLLREEVLQNTVEQQYGYFKIIKVVE